LSSQVLRTDNDTLRSLYRDAWRRFLQHRLAVIGLVFIILLVLIAVLAPLLAPHDPYEVFRLPDNRYNIWGAPSAQHWLGTDSFGRDVLSRVIYGSRVSLSVGLSVAIISTVIGMTLGAIAGYAGGWVDSMIMRFTDAVVAFPVLFLLITFAVLVGPSLVNVIVLISLVYWTRICRIVRAEFLKLKEMDFVLAAHAIGAPKGRVILLHLLPNSIASVTVNATLDISRAILLEASLSFLGVGVQQPIASWGNLLTEAMSLSVIKNLPWLWLPPGICILLTVLSLSFLGDGLRDAVDPRSVTSQGAS